MTNLAISKACLQAYVDKDRQAIEQLIADDFRFTSPVDNGLDRATYLDRCWPNSHSTTSAMVTASATEAALAPPDIAAAGYADPPRILG